MQFVPIFVGENKLTVGSCDWKQPGPIQLKLAADGPYVFFGIFC